MCEEHNALKTSQVIINKLDNMSTHVTEIKNGQGKHNLIVLGVVFIAGVAVGTQFPKWSPYLGDIIKTVKQTNNLTKG